MATCRPPFRIYFFSLFNFIVMSVLVCQYLAGFVLVSVWYVGSGIYVYSSQLGWVSAPYFELPAAALWRPS